MTLSNVLGLNVTVTVHALHYTTLVAAYRDFWCRFPKHLLKLPTKTEHYRAVYSALACLPIQCCGNSWFWSTSIPCSRSHTIMIFLSGFAGETKLSPEKKYMSLACAAVFLCTSSIKNTWLLSIYQYVIPQSIIQTAHDLGKQWTKIYILDIPMPWVIPHTWLNPDTKHLCIWSLRHLCPGQL